MLIEIIMKHQIKVHSNFVRNMHTNNPTHTLCKLCNFAKRVAAEIENLNIMEIFPQ